MWRRRWPPPADRTRESQNSTAFFSTAPHTRARVTREISTAFLYRKTLPRFSLPPHTRARLARKISTAFFLVGRTWFGGAPPW